VETTKRDNFGVSRLGLAVCIVALFAGFAVLKENRLSTGLPFYLWRSAGAGYLILLIALLLLIVGILLFRRPAGATYLVLAASGNLIIVLTFVSLAVSARSLLSGAAEFSRVSPGPGAWILLLGGYIVITGAVREIRQPVVRNFSAYFFVVVLIGMAASGTFGDLSIAQEYLTKKERFGREFFNHLSIAFTSVGFATLIGIPLGILAYRKKKLEKPVFYVVNTAQTIPSLALFGLLIAPLSFLSNQFPALRAIGIRGIGTAPALFALTFYALLPITRNTYTSLNVVDPAIIQAGKGMGLGKVRLLFSIEIPLATPVLLNGLRLAAVQAVGNTAVAALIGAGGLGFFIFQGLGQAATDLILLGTIPVVLLAIVVDRVMRLVIRLLTPEGIRLLKTGDEGHL